MKTRECRNPECKRLFELNRNTRGNVYCGQSCSTSHTNKLRPPVTEETRKNISIALIKNKAKRIESISKITRGKFNKNFKSIFELSSRTVQKILKRLKLGCSECGWDKATCDIHHIDGRKIEDADNHKNLVLLCPNCHRLVHEGKIEKDKLIRLNNYLPKNWKDFYYG